MNSPSHNNGIHTFGDPSLPDIPPDRPLNLMFLTSIRDVGGCDRNGQVLRTPQGLRYMQGAVERVVKETLPGGALEQDIRVVGVVTDDMQRDLERTAYPTTYHHGKLWIHPGTLQNTDGSLVANPKSVEEPETTLNIPSNFRALPGNAKEERAEGKLDFERRIAILMDERNVDVLLSDHYMARIEYLIRDAWEKFGRVLNIHPAVTLAGHPDAFPGKTPTQDAIDRACSGVRTRTGATLHIIDPLIDHGPVLAYTAETPVFPEDKPELLRLRNYGEAKLPVLIAGLRHYVRRIFPHLNHLDLNRLSPLPHADPALV
jgi:folate-dependent phosphoribosylglycinamide formyltransferase PurN